MTPERTVGKVLPKTKEIAPRPETITLPVHFPRPSPLPLTLSLLHRRQAAKRYDLLRRGEPTYDLRWSAKVHRVLGDELLEDDPAKRNSHQVIAGYLEEVAENGYPGGVRFLINNGILDEFGHILDGASEILVRGTEIFDARPEKIEKKIKRLGPDPSRPLSNFPRVLRLALEKLQDSYDGVKWTLRKPFGKTSLLFEEGLGISYAMIASQDCPGIPVTMAFGAGKRAMETVGLLKKRMSVFLVDQVDADRAVSGIKKTLEALGAQLDPSAEFIPHHNPCPGGPLIINEELLTLFKKARQKQLIVPIGGVDFTQPFVFQSPSGPKTKPVDHAFSFMAFHHNGEPAQAVALANMDAIADSFLVDDALKTGLGFARVVLPVGISLAKHSMVDTHGDAIITYVSGATVAQFERMRTKTIPSRENVTIEESNSGPIPSLSVRIIGFPN